MTFDYLETKKNRLYSNGKKNQTEYYEFDVLVDISDLVDCINAFEKKRRILKRGCDLDNLRSYAKRLVSSTTNLINYIE